MRKKPLVTILVLFVFLTVCCRPVPASDDSLSKTSDPSSDTAASSSSSASSAPASSYKTLQRGDKGDDVRKMQKKLIELGYLNDTADGSFGPKTAEAVRKFNEANGLHSDAIADAATQDCLYGQLADDPYTEPRIPVDLPRTEWSNITEEGASYRVQVTNTSKSRTIKAIKLQYYPTDVWGDDLWPKYRQTTFTMTIEPGQTEYTDWFYMSPSWYTIDTIYWGIAMIVFDDGTICENDDIAYWTISLH